MRIKNPNFHPFFGKWGNKYLWPPSHIAARRIVARRIAARRLAAPE